MTPKVSIMSGVRVLEVAAWTFVPMAGGVLAEWGADVLKVEHPEFGDPQRGLVVSGMLSGGNINFIMEHGNRGKRSVGIDLATEDGHRLLLDLAAKCDVFLTNFLPDARKRLGIEVEDIRAVSPNIVYARGSGNGPLGPEANRGGYDLCTFWARGGSADMVFMPDMEYPVPQPGGGYGDTIGGFMIAGGIAAALLHRERTGEAVVVDSSLLAVGAWASSLGIAGVSAHGLDRYPTPPREKMSNPIVNTYRTSDGRFLSLVMLQSDRYWAELMQRVGRPELVDDPRFVDSKARAVNRSECIGILDEIFAARTFVEWKEVLLGVEGIWSPVQTPREVIDDPQVVANGYVRDVVAQDGTTTFKLVGAPVQFNEQPADIRRAPSHGEHTDEILQELLGLDMEQILGLKVSGAVL